MSCRHGTVAVGDVGIYNLFCLRACICYFLGIYSNKDTFVNLRVIYKPVGIGKRKYSDSAKEYAFCLCLLYCHDISA